MTHAERTGTALGGAILLAIPVGDAIVGAGAVSAIHFIVGLAGAALIAAGALGRFR